MEGDNPYAEMEGYTVYDASGAEVGRSKALSTTLRATS